MWQVIVVTAWTVIAGAGGGYLSKRLDVNYESRRWARDQQAATQQWVRDQ